MRFTDGHHRSPWISRHGPKWGDFLFDFIMFEAKIMGNDAPTIRADVVGDEILALGVRPP